VKVSALCNLMIFVSSIASIYFHETGQFKYSLSAGVVIILALFLAPLWAISEAIKESKSEC
jgi:hypothetical protein